MKSGLLAFRLAKVIVLLPTLILCVCSPSPPDSSFIHLVFSPTSIQASGGVVTASATCPSGQQLIGGGFTAAPNGTALVAVTDNYPSSPNTWKVSAQVGEQASPGEVIALAYCFTTPNVQLGLTTVTGNTVAPPPTSPLSPGGVQISFSAPGTAVCPAGSVLTGGGYSARGLDPTTAETYNSYISTEGPSSDSTGRPNGWQTTLTYINTVAPTATAFAICARSYFTQGTIVTANASAVLRVQTGDVHCPPNTFTTGGGYTVQQSIPIPLPYTVYSSFSSTQPEPASTPRKPGFYDASGWHSDSLTTPFSATVTMSTNCIPLPR
jgi:hypothetical protein